MSKSTSYNMQSVTSNAVYNALSWTTKTETDALSFLNFSWASGYSGTVSIDSFAMSNNLIIMGIALSNVSGASIGTSGTAIIGSCSIKPKSSMTNGYGVNAIAIDYARANAQVRLGIWADGRFAVMESVGVVSGNNALRATFVIPI